MAVLKVQSIKKYVGVSGDTKPTLTVRDAGSYFHATNTNVTSIWHGTAWVDYKSMGNDIWL